MSATRSWYRQKCVINIVGGFDFEFGVVIEDVASTDLEGKITELIRLGPKSLVGWTEFRGEMRTFDGLHSTRVLVELDGTGDEGAIVVKGFGSATWTLQQAGVRAGFLDIGAKAPNGGRFRIVPMRWNLEPGSTSPLAGV